MTDYRKLDQKSVLKYVVQKDFFKETILLTCNKLSDNKLNHIFQISDQNQKTVIIKQAKSNSFSAQERINIEVERTLEHHRCCPEHTVKVLLHDSSQSCFVMQDVSEYQSIITTRTKGETLPNVGQQLGYFLAHTLFYTSDFYLSKVDKNTKICQLINSDNQLTTDYSALTEPDDELNLKHLSQASLDFLFELKQDETFKSELAELKAKCLNSTQAFVHGNLTPEHILIDNKNIKVINTKYAFYGPIGFDIGTVLGSFLLDFCTSALSLKSHQRADHLDYLIQSIRDIWHQFANIFSDLMESKTKNLALQNTTYQARFLRSIFLDSLGYAGCELIRQATMAVPLIDFNMISDKEEQEKAKCHCIELGQILVNKRYQFVSINDVLLEAEAIIEKE